MKLLDVLPDPSHLLLGYLYRLVGETWFANGSSQRDEFRPDCLTLAGSVTLKPVLASHRLARMYPNDLANFSLGKAGVTA
jgi:hypothetical protein